MFSLKVWAKLSEVDVVWVTPRSLDFFKFCHGLRLSTRGLLVWKTALLAGCWAILLERNNFIFSLGTQSSIEDIQDKIGFWIAIWLSDVKEFKDCFLSDLTRGWHFLLQFGRLFVHYQFVHFYHQYSALVLIKKKKKVVKIGRCVQIISAYQDLCRILQTD